MIITPEEKTNDEVSNGEYYECPTCRVQTTASKVQTSWVLCPMIGGKDICIGCCIDLQVVASSRRFENHPIFSDFLEVANKYRKLPSKMRIICVNHQIELCEDFLKSDESPHVSTKDVTEFLAYLKDLRLKIMSD